MVIPAFAWALTGAWPHATQVDQGVNQQIDQQIQQSVSLELQTVAHVSPPALFNIDAAAIEVFEATNLARAPALSVALFTGEAERLFPVYVHVEVLDSDGKLLLDEEVQAVDGQQVALDEVIATSGGQRIFRIQTVARHHIGDVIELDWELEVHEANFEGLEWDSYLLHRFNLGPRPALEQATLAAARADIVEVADAPFVEHFRLGDEDFELRLFAQDHPG